MFGWLSGKGASARKVRQVQAAIPEQDWRSALDSHDFLHGLSADEQQALRTRAAWILASKQFTAVRGLALDEAMRLSIALQAALPILNLDPGLYEGWTEIVLYPGEFMIPREEVDEAGVVHQYLMPASGEAWEGGPVILSWAQSGPQAAPGMNVVIHEFTHKLDLLDGEANGMPYLGAHPGLSARRWREVLEDAFHRFEDMLDAVEEAIPPDVDPESEDAAPWYDQLPLDPYAATDPAEFFAVSSESFFVDPAPLASTLPRWYDLLADYYRQDPLRRLESGRG